MFNGNTVSFDIVVDSEWLLTDYLARTVNCGHGSKSVSSENRKTPKENIEKQVSAHIHI